MPSVDPNSVVQHSIDSVLSSIPWWFWILLVAVGAAKVVMETTPKQRRGHNRSTALPHSGIVPVFNENLMPCPDCKQTISMKASTCPHCGAPISSAYIEQVQAGRNFDRRRAQTSEDVYFLKSSVVFCVVFLVAILFIVVHYSSGVWAWVLAVPIVLLIFAGLWEAIRLGDKGYLGEEIVKIKLSQLRPKELYKVLNDVYLPIVGGGTTQIDHIVVSPFGVFVVETKNFSGWIFADEKSPTWTQILGNTKNQFQNPIRQNYLHLRSIVDDLGLPEHLLHGIIAFADDCEFKTHRPEGVVFFNELNSHIVNFTERVIKDDDIEEIVKTIREWNASVTAAQRANHVNNLKAHHHG